MEITKEQLKQVLTTIDDETGIMVQYITDAEMYKKDNPFMGCIQKCTTFKGTIGKSYEQYMNEAMVARGETPNFIAKPRPWGTNIGHSMIEHKGEYYLNIKLMDLLVLIFLQLNQVLLKL